MGNTDFSLDRGLPSSPDAEKAILGAIILENDLAKDALSDLRAEHFYLDAHRRIFQRINDLSDLGRPIDTLTLAEELGRNKELDGIGGVAYLSTLTDGVPRRASIEHYIRIVRDKALRRSLIHAANGITAMALDGSDPAMEVLDAASQTLIDINASAPSHKTIRTFDDIADIFSLTRQEVAWFIEDRIPLNSVVVLSSDAGVGKTWLALDLVRAATLSRWAWGRKAFAVPVLYLDRENPLSLMQSRLDLMFGEDTPGLRIWGMWDKEPPPLLGDPRYLEIARKLRPLFVFDTLSCFHEGNENDAVDMSPVMAHVRAIAAAGGTVLLLHHRAKHEASNYRGSSVIPAAVDVAIRLSSDEGLLKLESFKNRFGPSFKFTLQADFERGTFEVTESARAHKRQSELDTILAAIAKAPGLAQAEIVRRVGINKARAIELLEQNNGSMWRWETGPRNSKLYFPLTCSAAPEQV